MCMKERINVLSTEMDCITAKEAMLKAIAFLERESVDIIEVLSMSALMRARDEDLHPDLVLFCPERQKFSKRQGKPTG